MRIHQEGQRFLLGLGLVLIALNVLISFWLSGWFLNLTILASLLLFAFFFQFFRNPVREVPGNDHIMVSPADGKVVVKEQVYEPEWLMEERIQVSIFMSPLDVHLNRVPVSGQLAYYRYHPGQYLAAYHPKSSEKNEMNAIGIRNRNLGDFFFRQIAGVVARRIQFYYQEGDEMEKGKALGFIKFGSRMDLFLPLDCDIRVSLGDQVYGGASPVAEMPAKQATKQKD